MNGQHLVTVGVQAFSNRRYKQIYTELASGYFPVIQSPASASEYLTIH